MVPLIATKVEFDLIKARIDATAQAVMKETGTKLDYQVGTMIELPRACLMAGEIAETAEFFSFGTNDLTQTTFGISRDDAASFLGTYIAKGILEIDPFISVDRDGVGELVKIGVARGRKTRPESQGRASAASTAAIRLRWRSATRSGSTTCRARPTACRSRVSPRRRPRSARPSRARRRGAATSCGRRCRATHKARRSSCESEDAHSHRTVSSMLRFARDDADRGNPSSMPE